MVGPKKQDFCNVVTRFFKDFIWFFEMEEHGASEAHKNEFLNDEILKI